MSFIVAIDGTAGSGKGTVTKVIAKDLGLINIDTGAMYRSVAFLMLEKEIEITEKQKIIDIADQIKIEFKREKEKELVFANGRDVTEQIRSKEVTNIVAPVSAIKEVREKMVLLQREMAKNQDVIMEGRDITTVVFPNAQVKIYLDATPEIRAERRLAENQEKGINMSYEEVLEAIKTRDEIDKNKEVGALKIAKDAIVIDTTSFTISEVVQKIEQIIEDKKENKSLEVENYKKIEKKKHTNKESFGKRFQKACVGGILKFLYRLIYRVKIVGEENIPKEGAFILCGNHVSFIKVPVIVLFTKRKVHFIAKAELFDNPILSYLGKLYDVIPVKRGKQDLESMKRSLKVLSNGEVLGLFPEGTRNGIQKKVKVKNGAAYMALRTGMPVVPVGIGVTKGPFPQIILNYGKPLDYHKQKAKVPEKEVLEETTSEIMDNIIKLTNGNI